MKFAILLLQCVSYTIAHNIIINLLSSTDTVEYNTHINHVFENDIHMIDTIVLRNITTRKENFIYYKFDIDKVQNKDDVIEKINKYDIVKNIDTNNDIYTLTNNENDDQCNIYTNAPPHLSFLNSKYDGNYSYKSNNKTIVYVLDKDLNKDMGYDIIYDVKDTDYEKDKYYNGTDPHGAHVVGLISSEKYGVNPNVQLFFLDVFGSTGEAYGDVLYDASFAILQHVSDNNYEPENVIINLSIGTRVPSSVCYLNPYIEVLAENDFNIFISAGNSNDDACLYYPGCSGVNYDNIIVVGSIDYNGTLSSFSNYGDCVDIYTYGNHIKSYDWFGSEISLSGTSMATPLVSGAVSIYGMDVVKNSPWDDTLNARVLSFDCDSKFTVISRNTASSDKILSYRSFIYSLVITSSLVFQNI